MAGGTRSGVVRLPFRQTLAAAFRETLNGIGGYWIPLVVSVTAWSALGGLDVPPLYPGDASTVPTLRTEGPGGLWQAKLAGLLILAMTATAILAMSVQRQVLGAAGTELPQPWHVIGRRGARYTLKLAAFLALSVFLWVVAGRIGGWLLAAAAIFAEPVLGERPGATAATAWAPLVLEIACFALTGLLLHIPVVRMLPLLPATAVSDPYMTFSESYEWSYGSGLRLLAGTLIALLTIPVAIACFVYAVTALGPAVQHGWLTRAAWSAVLLLGMCTALGFIALAYRHFAQARDRLVRG